MAKKIINVIHHSIFHKSEYLLINPHQYTYSNPQRRLQKDVRHWRYVYIQVQLDHHLPFEPLALVQFSGHLPYGWNSPWCEVSLLPFHMVSILGSLPLDPGAILGSIEPGLLTSGTGFNPLCYLVRRKFHPGPKCHSPHYCGPCLSISLT